MKRYEAKKTVNNKEVYETTLWTEHLQSALTFIGDNDGTIIDHTEGVTYSRKDFDILNQYLLLG